MDNPILVQEKIFHSLIQQAKETKWGKKYNYNTIHTTEAYRKTVPISEYDDLAPYINRMMHGEKDVLWHGQCKWFAKSSGTTSDKSKFIPVTKEILRNSHVKASWDVVTFIYDQNPKAKIFQNKNLVMGGSLESFNPYPQTKFGDVSAIMLHHMPKVGRPFYSPDFQTALLPNWDEKIDKIAQITSQENIVMFGGVPSWTLLLLRRILEISQKKNMLEVWPDVDVYIHGGVNFEPYRSQFETLFPSDQFLYMETYNASEGYFGIQNDFNTDDMLLLLDNGIYYEFIDMVNYDAKKKIAIPLSDIQIGVNYAMVISTESGLWRYDIGDTIRFTSTLPYKFKITGRTKHFINVFGEELMVSNTDNALSKTCMQMNCQLSEYTVGPIFIKKGQKGRHEWLIEFETLPSDIEAFASLLDQNIMSLNSDYEAKRFKNMALEPLKLNVLPKGSFYTWMTQKNKLGGQHKVPRLSNSRQYVEELLAIKNNNGV